MYRHATRRILRKLPSFDSDACALKLHVKRLLKLDKTKILMTNCSLMKVDSIADSAIL